MDARQCAGDKFDTSHFSAKGLALVRRKGVVKPAPVCNGSHFEKCID